MLTAGSSCDICISMDGCDNCPKNKKLNPAKEQKLREKAEIEFKRRQKNNHKKEMQFQIDLKNNDPSALSINRYEKIRHDEDAMNHRVYGSYGTGKRK